MDRRAPSVRSFVPYEYYSFRVSGIDDSAINYQIWSAIEKHELSIGINGRLCSFNSHICLQTEELANAYKDKKLPQWKKQWGEQVEIDVMKWSSSDTKGFFKVLEHSDLVKTRLKIFN